MNICRVCLSSQPEFYITQLQDINSIKDEEKQSYQKIMLFCLGIQVTESEEISTKLCGKCFNKIVEFYELKILALKNDAHFKCIYKGSPVVFMGDGIIKKESETEAEECSTEINFEEELVYLKEECTDEDFSDDEYLSAIKNIKDNFAEKNNENVKKNVDQIKEVQNKPKRKKKGRPKTLEKKIKLEPKKICDECGKEVRNLNTHLKQHQPIEDRKTVKCESCDKLFSSTHSKRKHFKRKHLGISHKKKCDICDKWYAALDVHIMSVHKPELLPFECASCGRRFITKSLLINHISLHTKDKPFECELCDGKYRTKHGLMLHIRQVHNKEKSHLCQFCSKSFFKKYHLLVHLRSHTKEKPYNCPQCKKSFSSTTTLANHRYTHNEEKKFNCTLCFMSFMSPNYLRAHMISHTKEKKYPCQYCDVRFHRSDHRKRHEYTAHLKNTNSSTTNATS